MTRGIAEFERMVMRVANDDPVAYETLMRWPLTKFTLHCEIHLGKLVQAKKQREQAKRNQNARRRR